MIERHWKGIAKTTEADKYIQHLVSDTFPKLSKMNGFIKASILQRKKDTGVEFLIITVWESYKAIMQFTGEQVDIAVVPGIVQEMMISFDNHVFHYEVMMSTDHNILK